MAALEIVTGGLVPVSQLSNSCMVSTGSFDCSTTSGYDPTKTYFISGIDPATCKPICAVANAAGSSKIWSRDSAKDGGCVGAKKDEAYACLDANGCDADKPVVGLPTGPNGQQAMLSVSCSPPSLTQISENDTGPGGIRTQTISVGSTVNAGTVCRVEVYSHPVTVVSVAGDTPATVVGKIVSAVNSTTAAQWNSANSAPSSSTNGFKPTATATAADSFTLKLNYQNSFAVGVSP